MSAISLICVIAALVFLLAAGEQVNQAIKLHAGPSDPQIQRRIALASVFLTLSGIFFAIAIVAP